jgi:hypothetical protein
MNQNTAKWYQMTFDASPLAYGNRYSLCLDVDGPAGPMVSMDTSLSITVAAAYEIRGSSVLASPSQSLQIRCDIGSGACSQSTSVMLSTACDTTDYTGSADAKPPFHSQSNRLKLVSNLGTTARLDPLASATNEGSWYTVSLDGSGLFAGNTYQLCADYDGGGPKTFGETGLVVMVTPLAANPRGSLVQPKAGQILDLACVADSATACSSAVGYLGYDCNIPSRANEVGGTWETSWSSITATVLTPGSKPSWRMTFDASNLRQGSAYKLCLDADGPKGPATFIDTGYWAYVSGAAAIEPTVIYAASSSTVVEFTVTCLESLTKGSSTTFSQQPAGCRAGGHAALCESGRGAGRGGEDIRRTPRAQLVRSGSKWRASLNVAGLVAGTYYSLCIDIDGNGATHALVSTSILVFVTTSVVLNVQSLSSAQGRDVTLTCLKCESSFKAFFANSCVPALEEFNGAAYVNSLRLQPPWTTPASYRTRTVPIVPQALTAGSLSFGARGAVGTWTAEFDMQPLPIGLEARLCLGYGGQDTGERVGDSGASVYVAGVTALQTPALQRGPKVALVLTCADGCKPGVTEAFISSSCAALQTQTGNVGSPRNPLGSGFSGYGMGGTSTYSGTSGVVVGGVPNYTLYADTRSLLIGLSYRVCIDHDGAAGPLPFADSRLLVTISSVALQTGGTEVTIERTTAQIIKLRCTEGCKLSSRLFLVTTTAACIDQNKVSTTVPIQPDGLTSSAGAFGGYGTAGWKVTFDASSIPIASYRLCVDLDGFGTTYAPGNTEILVNVISATTLA